MPFATTDTLEIEYLEHGPQDGWPVILSHGFPYGPCVFDEVVPLLIEAGARVITPFLRGYGGTRFLSTNSMRSGQQAALAADLVGLLDALKLDRAIVGGFDWGGLASCTAAALFPERIVGVVGSSGYEVLDVKAMKRAAAPELERTMWYQHLFQGERGKECLKLHRREIAKMLWKEWSPNWTWREEVFEQAAKGFENDDFIDVVTSHYRHAMGNFGGDARYERLEQVLATRPKINVPAVTVDGLQDPLKPGGTESDAKGMFIVRHEHWKLEIGHSFPLEAPEEFAKAVLMVKRWTD